MSRLTKKDNRFNCGYQLSTYYNKYEENVITKLGQLEDLEEELSCPLEVVFKALKEGIVDDCNIFYRPIEISLGVQLYQGTPVFVFKNFDQQEAVMCVNLGLNYFPNFWLLKDYGKTWWVAYDTIDD